MAIFGEASSTAIAGFILTGVSFLIHFIGFATPYWIYISSGNVKSYQGLWQGCLSVLGKTQCARLICGDACPGAFKIAQAMATLGFLVLLAAVIIVALKMFVIKDKPILRSIGVCCCFIGGTCALIGTIAYGTIDDIKVKNLSFSFAFCIIAAAGSYLSGCLLIAGK